jgi:HlyD family secretion protein
MNKPVFFAVSAALLLALAGWGIAKRNEANEARIKAESQKKPDPVIVQTVKPRAATIDDTVSGLGSLESPYTVKLSPNVAGRIDYLNVREGDPVTKGEVLARIDPEQVEGQILQARATLAQAQHSLAQARVTQTANTVGIESTVRQDQAGVASAQADYNEAVVTYNATVGAAHQATVDAQSKVRAAESQVQVAQANEQLAEANLKDAQAKYTRQFNLYKQVLVAAQDVDDARAAMKVDQATVNSDKRLVQVSEASLESARQEEKEAENQETITIKKGNSTIEDAKSVLTQSNATLRTAAANRSQIPAYEENLKALQSAVFAAQGALNQAIAQRSFLIVTSSIDGTVTQRLADPGAEASPGSQILVIQYLKWLYLTAYLPGDYADKVKVGDETSVTLDAFPGKTFTGTISDVNKSVDPSSRQFMVRLKLQNPDHKFRPGMYAKISLVGARIQAQVAVPTKSVTFAADGTATVTTVDAKNLAHVVSITYGVQDGRHVEITSGVTPKDRVVLASDTPLDEDTLVKEGTVVKKISKKKS